MSDSAKGKSPEPPAQPAGEQSGKSTPPINTPASPPATAVQTQTQTNPGIDAPIEIDPGENPDDGDSSYDDRISTFTASLTSSVLNYPVEYGRQYHAFRPGVYPMPNDEPELDRLDLSHGLMTKGLGDKLFLAPIEKEKVRRILDIGTGTGIWAITMGDEYPAAEVLGNDLSPVQENWVPPNVHFEVDDVESPWTYNKPFDFIFCRYMTASILDWPKLVSNIYEHTRPGGWAEFQDFNWMYQSEDGSLKEDSATYKWITLLLEGSNKIGREPSPGPRLEGWAKDVGFTNLVHRKFKFPIGPWARDKHLKEIGLFNLTQALQGLEAFSMRLYCGVLGWKEAEVLILLSDVRKELKRKDLHCHVDFHVVYGQKPA